MIDFFWPGHKTKKMKHVDIKDMLISLPPSPKTHIVCFLKNWWEDEKSFFEDFLLFLFLGWLSFIFKWGIRKKNIHAIHFLVSRFRFLKPSQSHSNPTKKHLAGPATATWPVGLKGFPSPNGLEVSMVWWFDFDGKDGMDGIPKLSRFL